MEKNHRHKSWELPRSSRDRSERLNNGHISDLTTQSYTDEPFDENGLNETMAHKEDGIFKAHIRFGHSSSKTYNLWVEYNQGLNPVTGWHCGCRSGTWTIGCCAHIASVLWYLGYNRHQTENNDIKTKRCPIIFLQDAAIDTWSASSDSEVDE